MTTKLKKAIKELKEAGKKFVKQNPEQDNQCLYNEVVGDAWNNYCKAGGSLDMINK